MEALLAQLGSKILDRWLSLIVLPGAIFVVICAAARLLGQRRALDPAPLQEQVTAWAQSPTLHSPGGFAAVLGTVLIGAAVSSMVAQGAGALIERIWLAEDWHWWPRPLHQLALLRVRSRRARWAEAQGRYTSVLESTRQRAGSPVAQNDNRPDLASVRRQSVKTALETPERPTWIGDRLNAVAIRLARDYELDIATVWPALALTLPDNVRIEIDKAHADMDGGALAGGWAVLYAVAGIWWWPALLVSAALAVLARHRARTSAEEYAQLLENATRLYAADLARQLGLKVDGTLDRATGWALTCHLQGRSDLAGFTPAPAQKA